MDVGNNEKKASTEHDEEEQGCTTDFRPPVPPVGVGTLRVWPCSELIIKKLKNTKGAVLAIFLIS